MQSHTPTANKNKDYTFAIPAPKIKSSNQSSNQSSNTLTNQYNQSSIYPQTPLNDSTLHLSHLRQSPSNQFNQYNQSSNQFNQSPLFSPMQSSPLNQSPLNQSPLNQSFKIPQSSPFKSDTFKYLGMSDSIGSNRQSLNDRLTSPLDYTTTYNQQISQQQSTRDQQQVITDADDHDGIYIISCYIIHYITLYITFYIILH